MEDVFYSIDVIRVLMVQYGTKDEERAMLTPKNIPFVTCLLCLVIPASVFSQIITVEAESFTTSQNAGAQLIRMVNFYLYGLDFPGDWAEYNIECDSYGQYSPQIRIRGAEGESYEFRLTVTADVSGDTQSYDVSFVGADFG